MKKYIFMCVIIVVLLLGVCLGAFGRGDTDSDVRILGGIEGEDWLYTNSKLLQIKSDGITITGTAKTDLTIICEENASSLTIDGLEQNSKRVSISSLREKDKGFTLNVKGKNELCKVFGHGSMNVKGIDAKEELVLTCGMISVKNLKIEDVSVCAGVVESYENMSIEGVVVLGIKKMQDEAEEISDARIKSGGSIHIDLSPKGSITVKADNGLLPFFAEKKIILGKNNKIVIPENGVAKSEDTPYGPNCSFIFTEDGEWDCDVVIKNNKT